MKKIKLEKLLLNKQTMSLLSNSMQNRIIGGGENIPVTKGVECSITCPSADTHCGADDGANGTSITR
jgi:hypothetical protein